MRACRCNLGARCQDRWVGLRRVLTAASLWLNDAAQMKDDDGSYVGVCCLSATSKGRMERQGRAGQGRAGASKDRAETWHNRMGKEG